MYKKPMFNKNIKAAIFDMDGTLINNIPYHLRSWQIFFENHGLPFNQSVFQAQNHGNIREMIRRHVDSALSDEEATLLGNEKEQIYREIYARDIQEIEGLSGFLEKLTNEKITIALATMGDMENINFVLDKLNIRKYFHSISGGHEIKRGKPHPDIFNLAARKLDVANSECVVFEDSQGGIQAAMNAGMNVVGITTSHTSEELISYGCCCTIANFLDFPRIFRTN
jgi:beta-phosphoglucomutase